MALELEDQPWAYLDALTSRIEALRRRVEAIPDELPQTIGPSNNNVGRMIASAKLPVQLSV